MASDAAPAADSTACIRRETCRLCDSRDLSVVLELKSTPLANDFVARDRLDEMQPTYPLALAQCADCGHAQLTHVVDPRILFDNYVYVSGTSGSFVRHFDDYAREMTGIVGLERDDLVIDVGSNDGTLLRFFADGGCRILGIDPAQNIAKAANESGIPTVDAYLTPALAEEIRAEYGGARLVTANNVFAHVNDLRGFTEAVRVLLAPDGLFTFEVSYLGDVIGKTLFDTIYHEHLDYHAVGPLHRFFRSLEMEIVRVDRHETHGGSIRVMVGPAAGSHPSDPSVYRIVEEERNAGLLESGTFHRFGGQIAELKARVVALLSDLKAEGRSIAAYGAPAKITTFMYEFGLDSDTIDFIIDDSPLKQGLYTPGFHIPVVPAERLYDRAPDYVVITAWNFAPQIAGNHKAYTDAGGHFIVPAPELEVI